MTTLRDAMKGTAQFTHISLWIALFLFFGISNIGVCQSEENLYSGSNLLEITSPGLLINSSSQQFIRQSTTEPRRDYEVTVRYLHKVNRYLMVGAGTEFRKYDGLQYAYALNFSTGAYVTAFIDVFGVSGFVRASRWGHRIVPFVDIGIGPRRVKLVSDYRFVPSDTFNQNTVLLKKLGMDTSVGAEVFVTQHLLFGSEFNYSHFASMQSAGVGLVVGVLF